MTPNEDETVNGRTRATFPVRSPMVRGSRQRAGRHRWAGGIVLSVLLAWVVPAAAGEIVVVGNPDLPVDALSADDIRAIYLGEQTFVARTKVYPVEFGAKSPLSEAFLHTVVRMSPAQFQTYWVKEVFQSGRLPPRNAVNPADVVNLVASDPGAIGYVPAEALQGVHSVKRLFSVRVP